MPPTISLFIDWIEQRYHTAIRDGIEAAAREQGANLICFAGGSLAAPARPEAQRNAIYQLASRESVDGIIIMSASISHYVGLPEFEQFCARYRPLPIVSMALALEGVPSIVVDNKTGMRALLVHLIEGHGYRRIVFIRGREGNIEAEQRYCVYKEVLAAYGLPLDPGLVITGNFNRFMARDALEALLNRPTAVFDAVVAANDEMAIGALQALQAQGKHVPDQVAIAGFDDTKYARLVTPSLTTVRQPLYEQGRRAVEMLMGLLRGETVPEQIILPTELQVRHSCGCLAPVIKPVTDPESPKDRRLQANALAERARAGDAPDEGAQLLEGFAAALNNQTPDIFLKTLDRTLRQISAEGGEVAAWQRALSALRRRVLPHLNDKETLLRAGLLWQQAQELIIDAQQAQVYWHFQAERQTLFLLHQVGQVLITTFDIEQLLEAISEQLFRLGIARCYLALYESESAEWSRLILDCEDGRRRPLETGGRRFLSREVLPRDLRPAAAPYALVAESLYFGEEQFGFAVFGAGPRDGIIYDVLAVQISNALKGALLVQQVQNHAATLETEVAARTLELTQANEQLQREIVERQRADEKLAQQARQLAEAQSRLAEIREAEQLRMAQDLHDGAVQQLIGVSYAIEGLRRRVSERGERSVDARFINELANSLQQTRRQVLDVSKQLRSLISELRPAGLKELGLLQALEGYVAHLERDFTAESPVIKLALPKSLPPMPEVAAICLFRVAQEALRNALQHAQARQINLGLDCAAGEAVLSVRDDGVGFQAPAHFSELTRDDHFGLAGMAERVAWSNGQLTIHSQPGLGTEIVATVPLTKP